MKKAITFMFLFLSTFMLSSIGSVSNVDALGMYGCSNGAGFDGSNAHIDCLRGKLDGTSYGMTRPSGSRGHRYYSCDRMPNGNLDTNSPRHVNCLRALLDEYAPHLATNSGPRHSSGGTAHCDTFRGVARTACMQAAANSGPPAPEPYDDRLMGGTHNTGNCAQFRGAAQTACYAAANSGPPAGGTAHCDTFRGAARTACMNAPASSGRP